MTAHKPAWSGATHIIGNDKHILPLYETDRDHKLQPDCGCNPDVLNGQIGADRLPYTIYTHHNVKFQQ
jgi:hypothetical protein